MAESQKLIPSVLLSTDIDSLDMAKRSLIPCRPQDTLSVFPWSSRMQQKSWSSFPAPSAWTTNRLKKEIDLGMSIAHTKLPMTFSIHEAS